MKPVSEHFEETLVCYQRELSATVKYWEDDIAKDHPNREQALRERYHDYTVKTNLQDIIQELKELLAKKAFGVHSPWESDHRTIQRLLRGREGAIRDAERHNSQFGPMPKAEFCKGDRGTGKLHRNSTRLSRSRDETGSILVSK